MPVEKQINLRPAFETNQVPCDGEVGDLFVMTPVPEGKRDASPQGLGSLWFCTKGSFDPEGEPAVWARVQFDGVASCKKTVPDPPQNRPNLIRG